jgi:hypothetical protein
VTFRPRPLLVIRVCHLDLVDGLGQALRVLAGSRHGIRSKASATPSVIASAATTCSIGQDRELMQRMAHSTPDAAIRYQHATNERDRAIADALDRLAGDKEQDEDQGDDDTGEGHD